MRRLLRRLAWLLSRLFFVVMISFMALATSTKEPQATNTNFASDRIEQSQVPLFFNSRPNDLELKVRAILQDPGAQNQEELHRLGGAVFPLLLPKLSELKPETRLRLARALLPVAQRMRWRGAAEARAHGDPAGYLADAWKERSVDFQTIFVTRWVERLASRGSEAMLTSVIEYDTYALGALVGALPIVNNQETALRARRLFPALAHATGLPWFLDDASSLEDIRDVADRWRRWWALHEPEYTVVRGPSRWSAMLKQTRFGQWVTLATQFEFGTTKDQRSVLEVLRRAAPRTATILVGCLIGVITAMALSLWRERLLSKGRLYGVTTLVVTSVPHVSAIALCAYFAPSKTLLTTTFAALLIFTIFATVDGARLEGTATKATLTSPYALSSASSRFAFLWRYADHAWPFLLTFVFVLENAFGIDGVGPQCVRAFRNRDLHLLMGIATLTALTSLLVIEFAARRTPNTGRALPRRPNP